jgi:hypothetical protein
LGEHWKEVLTVAKKSQKKPLEAVSGLYAPVPHSVMDSQAFKGAGHVARSLLYELIRQHTGTNNGHLHLSFTYLKNRGWTSRDVIQRARDELIKRELIVQTKKGGLNYGSSLFALTWLDITNCYGLDINSGSYHKGAYAMLDRLPVKNKLSVPSGGTVKPVRRNSPDPSGGTVNALTVP